MGVWMALPKAAGYMIVLLVVCYGLNVGLSSEEQMGPKLSHTHAREKRSAPSNSTDYVLEAVVSLSDLESVNLFLRTFSPISLLNNTIAITSIDLTTVCSLNGTEYQCRCEEGHAWSYNNCISSGACDAIIGDTCGCINDLPANDQYCQPADRVEFDLVIDVRIPVSSVSSHYIDLFRNNLRLAAFPYSITQSFQIQSVNFTTGCYPNSTGGLQCQCEEQFGWSCDMCNTYGICSNTTTQTCDCINGLPSDGQFCEQLTNITPCPTPSTAMTSMPANTTIITLNTTPMNTTAITMNTTPLNTTAMTMNTTPLNTTAMTMSTTPLNTTAMTMNTTPLNTTAMTMNTTPLNTTAMTMNTTPLNTTAMTMNTTPLNTTAMTMNTTPLNTTAMTMNTTPLNTTAITMSTTPLNTTAMTMNTTPLNTTAMTVNTTPLNTTAMTVNTTPLNTTAMTVNTTPLNTTAMTMNTTPLNTTAMTMNTTPLNTTAMTMNTTPLNTTAMTMNTTPLNTTAMTMNTTPLNTTAMTVNTTPLNTTAMTMNTTPLNTTAMTMSTTPLNTTAMTMSTTPLNTTAMTVNITPLNTTAMTMSTTPLNTTAMTMNTTPLDTTLMTVSTTPLDTTLMIVSTTPPVTTKPPMTTTPPVIATEVRELSFTLDMDYKAEFNNHDNHIYKTTSKSIQEQCQKFISNFQSLEKIVFKPGSTIVDYSVRATTFNDKEIGEVTSGIFTEMAKEFVMISESTESLKFTPSKVFLGDRMTVTCGPPPTNLNLGTDWTAKWSRNKEEIVKDSQHSFSKKDGVSTLTVSKSFATDNGRYECKLKKGNVVFREISNGTLTVKEKPQIQVKPITIKITCEVGKEVSLSCSVQNPYKVKFEKVPGAGSSNDISHKYKIEDCTNEQTILFTCEEETTRFKKSITLKLSKESFDCRNNEEFGDGNHNDRVNVSCPKGKVGNITAVCSRIEGNWINREDNCILQEVQNLFEQSETLTDSTLPIVLTQLSEVTGDFTEEVVASPNDINAIVQILNNIADASSELQITITESSMENFLLTVGILTTDEAKDSWDALNGNPSNETRSVTRINNNSSTTERASSTLLLSLEIMTKSLANDSFDIETPSILLNKTTITGAFNADFNSTVMVDIPDGGSNDITVLTFASMDNVLPARDENNSNSTVINGRVVLVYSSNTINNITFEFDILNEQTNNRTLDNPQCVFWNFSLFDNLGGWDDEGCKVVNDNETVTCNCNHLTSFSILMSPSTPIGDVIEIITYIGVGISMGSLVICLIIEAVIWRKIRRNNTSYLRHVSIVNIAVSLLIADTWFIIGAAINDRKDGNQPACSTTTFFVHFFYLALFFWMLASGLLLLYRTVSVFDGGLSKKSMLAIGFSLGYGAPLIITIITIAVTAPNQAYTRGPKVCWLNWEESRALLAFVIPALLIVFINLMILLVVIYKMLRRRTMAAQADEKHVLVVIARSLAVLTPIFGLTWGLGAGLLADPTNANKGIHISFAFFNSLQGFFILVFGTLLDKKVRSEIAIKSQTSSGTKTTSAGTSSSAGLGFFRHLARGRDGYNLSSTDNSANFINT